MDERNVRKENLASSHSRYSQSLAIIQQLGLDRGKRRYYQRGRTWTAKLMSRYNFHRLQEFEKIPSGRKSPRRSIGRLFPVPVGWAISMLEFFFPSRASIKTSTWTFYCNRMSRVQTIWRACVSQYKHQLMSPCILSINFRTFYVLDTCYNHWNRYFPYRNRYFPYKCWWLTWKGLRFWGKAGWVSLNSSYFTRTWSLGFQGPAIFSEMITISFMYNSFTRHALMSPCCCTNVAPLSREYRATVAWMSC